MYSLQKHGFATKTCGSQFSLCVTTPQWLNKADHKLFVTTTKKSSSILLLEASHGWFPLCPLSSLLVTITQSNRGLSPLCRPFGSYHAWSDLYFKGQPYFCPSYNDHTQVLFLGYNRLWFLTLDSKDLFMSQHFKENSPLPLFYHSKCQHTRILLRHPSLDEFYYMIFFLL